MLIDVTRLVRRAFRAATPNGIDRVSIAYVRHFRDEARAFVRWMSMDIVLSRQSSRALWEMLLAQSAPRRSELCALLITGGIGGMMGRRPARGEVFINTGHSGLEEPGYGERLRRRGLKPIFMIHDLIPITHPEYCGPPARDRHARRIRAALDHASAIITNSRATRHALERHARSVERRLPSVVTAALAPGLVASSPGPRPFAEPYFVMLGTIEARKNHWLVLQVWRGLVERFGRDTPRLMIIGQRGWECENVIDLLERCTLLRDHVSERSDCSDQELGNCLHHARALLFPSFIEGYGMPLVEALCLGVPAIVSDLPVFREIGGAVPEYIDPLDGRRWSEVVMEYASDGSELRKAQIERMSRFRVPTWSEHFVIVDELVSRVNGHLG